LKSLPIYSIAFKDSNIFAGNDVNLFLSSDKGKNWITKLSPGQGPCVISLINNYIIIGIYSGSNGGVYISSDNGISWKSRYSNPDFYYIESMVINDTDIFVGTYLGGIYYSSDYGITWIPKNNGLTSKTIITINFNKDNIYIATSGKQGIYISSNYGDSWIPKNNGLTNLNISSIATFNEKNVFAGTFGGGVFLSINKGDSWKAINDSLTNLTIWYIATNDKYIFAGTQGGLFRAKLSDFIKVDVSENQIEQNFSLFPNPVSDYLNLNFPKNNSTEIIIYNELGIPIFEKSFLSSGVTPDGTFKIDTRDYPPGVYFCQIKAGSYVETKKFIVIK
jgi:ligand-binding sensor domain-containing protein